MEKEKITDALRGISYPGFSRDIVSFGIVSKASVSEQKAVIELELSTQDSKIVEELIKSIEKKLLLLPEMITWKLQTHYTVVFLEPVHVLYQCG